MRKISTLVLLAAVLFLAKYPVAADENFNALKSQYDAGLADKRVDAITKLAALYKNPESLSVIKQALRMDADVGVREAACEALRSFSETQIKEDGLIETAFLAALDALADKEESVRKKSADVILSSFRKKADSGRLRDYLMQTARRDPTHSYEVLSLTLRLHPSASLALFEELSKENDNCRYAVARLITRLPAASTAPDTKQSLPGGHSATVESYNEATARLIENFLKDELPEIRSEAVRAVSVLKLYPLIKKSLPLITDKNPTVAMTAKESLVKLAENPAAIYWVGAMNTTSPEIKTFTIEALAIIGRADTFPYVFAALDDRSEKVRQSAARSARSLFSNDYVFFLINELSSPNSLKRKTALELLTLSKDTKIIPALLSSMAKERDKEILNTYTTTISEIAGRENIMDLREAVSNPRPEIRICAAKALAGIAKNYASPDNNVYADIFAIFLNQIKYEKNPDVQKEFLTNAFPSMSPVPYRLAYPWTKIGSREIKTLAADFLSRYGGETPESANTLVEALSENISDQDVAWRIKGAVEKLVRTPSDAAEISKYLSDDKKELRLFILGLMKKFPSETALKNLSLIDYKKADPEVKYAAIEVVRAAHPKVPPPILSEGIADKNPEIRWLATKALAEISDTPITETILSTLQDPNPAVREETLKILSRNPRFEYAPRIAPLLSDSEISVRRAALEAIQDIADADTVRKKIIPLLTDQDPSIRALAARICGKTFSNNTQSVATGATTQRVDAAATKGDTESIPFVALRKMAESDLYPECRREAAMALWKIKDSNDGTIAIYFSLLKDSDPETRKTAQEILDAILTDKTHKTHIIKALLDDNQNSRSYALKTISRLHLDEANPQLFNLVKMMKRGNKKENQELLDTLSKLLDENDVRSLEEIYNMGNPELKLWAIEQSGHLKSEGALNLITRALKEDNPAFRQKAVESLGRTTNPDSRAALKYIATNDPDPVLRKMAQEKLSKK